MSRIKNVKIRSAFFKAQDCVCFYCKGFMRFKDKNMIEQTHDMFTIDHIVPLAVFGDRHITSNLIGSCLECNKRKGNRIYSFSCEQVDELKVIHEKVDSFLLENIHRHLSYKMKTIVIPPISKKRAMDFKESYGFDEIEEVYSNRGDVEGYKLIDVGSIQRTFERDFSVSFLV